MPTPEHEAADLLDPVLAVLRTQLLFRLNGHAATAYIRGAAQMVQFGRTLTTDRPIYFEGPPMQQAINYANKHAAQMVTKMDVETKDRLAQVIGKAIKEKRGVDGLARDIRKEFEDMTKVRSKLIAQTETNSALSEGSFQRMKDLKVNGKRWVTVGDDRVRPAHLDNEAAGVIPIDQAFPDGSMHTPGVDPFGCRCVTVPEMLPE